MILKKAIQTWLMCICLFQITNSFALDAIASKKAAFILDVARNVVFDFQNEPTYKIGIYGTGREFRDLFYALEAIANSGTRIHGKPLEVFHFKRMKKVKAVELLYVSGDSKIRISSFGEQMGNHPYFLATENFPFGTSNFNVTTNKNQDVLYELNSPALKSKGFRLNASLLNSKNRMMNETQWQEKLLRAEKEIEEAKEETEKAKQIVEIQEKIVEEKLDRIVKQKATIDIQEEKLESKEEIIDNQRKFLILAMISVLVSGAFSFILYKLYKERNKIFLELESKNAHVISSINYAKKIQAATLPAKNLFGLFLPESFILYKPKDIVSGDFYWLETDGERVYFAVADCTGHGVPGAMMSVMCSNLLTKAVMGMKLKEPNEILDKSVELLEDSFVKSSKDIKDGMDISLCSYNIRKRELKYAGAFGALNFINKNGLQVIKGDRQPVGNHHSRKPFVNHTIQVEEGDCVYLASDGFADQFGGSKNKKFMIKAFRLLLMDIHEKPMSEQRKVLNDTFENWKGTESQIDDVCVMGIRF